MYDYSPIKDLRVKNFRNIGDVTLDFEKSPIITLVGDNEAGKTSIIKAFSACALHTSPREQKNWIRDDTKMFGIEIKLKDGTQIVRVKENGGINLYQVIKPDGTIYDTNKITDGLPVEVQNIMGLIEEPETGEYLHIRTYEDKLLFVVTPNSTNYKVMYNALKVEQLTKAIKAGSNEVNTLKSQINKNEYSIETLNSQLNQISVYDIDSLTAIRDKLKNQLNILNKLKKAMNLKQRANDSEGELGAIALVDRFNLKEINEVQTMQLSRINKLLNSIQAISNELNNISKASNLDEINIDQLEKLEVALTKKQTLENKKNELSHSGIDTDSLNIDTISESLVLQILRIKDLREKKEKLEQDLSLLSSIFNINEITENQVNNLQKLSRISNLYTIINTNKHNLGEINNYLESVQNYLKQCGVAVESCPKCGEAVIFDIEKLEDN